MMYKVGGEFALDDAPCYTYDFGDCWGTRSFWKSIIEKIHAQKPITSLCFVFFFVYNILGEDL